jgi:hypothetical protein
MPLGALRMLFIRGGLASALVAIAVIFASCSGHAPSPGDKSARAPTKPGATPASSVYVTGPSNGAAGCSSCPGQGGTLGNRVVRGANGSNGESGKNGVAGANGGDTGGGGGGGAGGNGGSGGDGGTGGTNVSP